MNRSPVAKDIGMVVVMIRKENENNVIPMAFG